MLKIKRVTWIIFILITICSAFFFGSIVGFNQGYAFSAFYRSTSEAYLTLTELENLNTGYVKLTKDSLERRLDTYIVEHSTGMDNKLFRALVPNQDSVNRLMKEVALYRVARLSTFTDKTIKDRINTVVASYIAKPS